jgi:hypothetical protein
MDEDISCN